MGTPGSEPVVLEVRDRVARLTLNRPDSLNALTPQMGRELLAALDRIAAEPEVRAVVLGGAGRAFCSGADLRQVIVPGSGGRPDVRTALDEIFHPLILRLRHLPKPVVAAVGGGAVGLGCALALACDLVFAARSSYFLLAFANVGLALDGGCSTLLVGRAGYGRASELALLAERIEASQARDWGLVNQVVEDAELPAAAAAAASRLAGGAPGAYAAIKQSLNAAAYPHLEQQLALEAALQQERGQSGDFVEGVQAFLEKRPPQFTGQ